MSHLLAERIEELAMSKAADPHLADCAECRKAVGSARARRMLLKGLKDLTLTDAAFRRVEAKLSSDVRAPVSAWAVLFAALRGSWGLGAAVVGLALVVLVPRWIADNPTAGPIVVTEPLAKNARITAPDIAVEWTVVAVEGIVSRNGVTLSAAEVARSSDVIDARMGRVVMTQLGHRVRFELIGLAKLGSAPMVSLEEGTLAVEASAEVAVEAAGAWVHGSDTAFVVSRAGAELVVEVLQGTARVGSDFALRDAVTLSAPQRLKVPMPVTPPFSNIDNAPVPYPFPKMPKQPWARLDVSDLPAGSTFDVDGQRSGVPTSMMLAEGRHRVMVQVPGQPSRETWVQLVSGRDTRLKLPPRSNGQQKDELPPSEEAVADLQRALKDQLPKLRACYEKWLKANPVATGNVTQTL